MFHEDDDLSLRLKQAGLELRLASRAVVEHSEGNSSARSAVVGRIKGEAMGRSLVYVMRKHEVPFDLARENLKTRWKLPCLMCCSGLPVGQSISALRELSAAI